MITNALSKCLWALPGRFGATRGLGPGYRLRSVLFHDVSAHESLFTDGLEVTMPPEVFEARIAFLKRHYTPVGLDQVFAAADGAPLPARPVLVTFDDAYASVARVAAPVLSRYEVPAVFFVNSAFVDSALIGLDNLLCFAVNTVGLTALDRAAKNIGLGQGCFRDLTHVIQSFTSCLGTVDIQRFREAVLDQLDRDPIQEAKALGLYLNSHELRCLQESGIEVGNHTRTHVWCRNLDRAGYEAELTHGRSELERLSGRLVRAFSVPYGESKDLTPDIQTHLAETGHQMLFLVEGLPNGARPRSNCLDRVTLKGTTDNATFHELEVLPRLRRIRNLLRRRGA